VTKTPSTAKPSTCKPTGGSATGRPTSRPTSHPSGQPTSHPSSKSEGAKQSSNNNADTNALSQDAQVGIGVGVAVAAIIIAFFMYLTFFRNKRAVPPLPPVQQPPPAVEPPASVNKANRRMSAYDKWQAHDDAKRENRESPILQAQLERVKSERIAAVPNSLLKDLEGTQNTLRATNAPSGAGASTSSPAVGAKVATPPQEPSASGWGGYFRSFWGSSSSSKSVDAPKAAGADPAVDPENPPSRLSGFGSYNPFFGGTDSKITTEKKGKGPTTSTGDVIPPPPVLGGAGGEARRTSAIIVSSVGNPLLTSKRASTIRLAPSASPSELERDDSAYPNKDSRINSTDAAGRLEL